MNCPTCENAVRTDAKFCPSCGRDLSTPVERTPSLSRNVKHPLSAPAKRVYTILAASLGGLFLYLFFTHLPGGAHPVIAKQPEVAMASMYMGLTVTPQPIEAEVYGGKVSFSLPSLLQYKAVTFDVATPTGTVPLIAFVTPDGKMVTSIRMCEPCNSKSFKIEGTELVCGNCETRWKLNNLEGIQGTCQKYPPDPIPSVLDGNHVVIEESAIRNWKMRI